MQVSNYENIYPMRDFRACNHDTFPCICYRKSIILSFFFLIKFAKNNTRIDGVFLLF